MQDERRVESTKEGLVLPGRDRKQLDRKIVQSLSEVCDRIRAAREHGLDVVYLPGSYDLVHLGHLAYVGNVISHYLIEASRFGRQLSREDLYIVMLADDDELISSIKAAKCADNGGDELFHRPVEAGLDQDGRSPRLDALASFPVDCVGFIPSPAAPNLPGPYPLDYHKCCRIAVARFSGNDFSDSLRILEAYQQIEGMFGHPGSLAGAFWRIAAWQLYVTLQLAVPQPSDVAQSPGPFCGDCLTRAISARDFEILGVVQLISRWSGVGVAVINDPEVVTTTGLLRKYRP